MSSDQDADLEDLANLAILGQLAEKALNLQKTLNPKKKKKRVWVKRWIERRQNNVPIFREIEVEDPEKFFNSFRLYPEQFDQLLQRLEPFISKKDTQMRRAIPARLRLQATLRYLTSGANYSVIEELFRIPRSTLSGIIPDVCSAIWFNLSKECIKTPRTEGEWLAKSQEFKDMWQYPFAVAAIDGKHVEIQAPAHSGTHCFNYKGFHSLILFAAADAQYKFIFVDIGTPGSDNDAAVWGRSDLKKMIDNQSINLPTNTNGSIKYHFLGDDIFGLSETLMKPYSPNGGMTVEKKIFNYRLSRARRVVENSFGILSSRFRVLRSPILLDFKNAKKVVQAVVTLHNFILENFNVGKKYLDPETLTREDREGRLTPGDWEQEGRATNNLTQVGRLAGNRHGKEKAHIQRDTIAKIMLNDKLAPWQFQFALGT